MAGLAVVVGVPGALSVYVGNPLPAGVPSFRELRDVLGGASTNDTTPLKVLALLMWAGWGAVVVSHAMEVGAVVRGTVAPRLRALGPAQGFATQVVASALFLLPGGFREPPVVNLPTVVVAAVGTDDSANAALAFDGNISPVAGAAVATAPPVRPAPGVDPAPSGWEPYIVVPGYNTWNIVERRTPGAGVRRVWEIVEAMKPVNIGRPQPSYGGVLSDLDAIHPGWTILVPAHVSGAPGAPIPTPREPSEPTAEATQAAVSTVPATAPAPLPPSDEATSVAASSADPDDCAPDATVEPSGSTVRLPSGSVVGLAFAMGAVGTLAAGAIHRRRAYRSTAPRATRAGAVRVVDEPFRTLAAATARAEGDQDPERSVGRGTWAERMDPNPARVDAAASANGSVDLDPLAFGMLRFDGDGADDIVRALVTSVVVRCLPPDLRVLVDSETAAVLFDIGESFPGVAVLATPAAVLDEAEVERARRARILDAADCDDFGSYRSDPCDELLGGLLLVGRPTSDDAQRWAALAAAGPRLGIGAVVLGQHCPTESLLTVGADGLVVGVDDDTRSLEGASLHRLTRSDAASVLREVAAAGRLAEAPEPGEQPTEEPFPVAVVREDDDGESDVVSVRVRLLGPFAIEADGKHIRTGLLDKSRELFAYLSLRPEGVGRERLLEDLWGDVDPSKRRGRLSATVSSLRNSVRAALDRPQLEAVFCAKDIYRLETELYDIDLWRFQQALGSFEACKDDDGRAGCLGAALSAYGGEFVHGAPWDWVEPERENLRRRALDVAVRLAELHEQAGRLDPAISAIERAIEVVDPYAEELYVRGVALLVAAGRIESARSLYSALRARLDELDVEPMPETIASVGELLSSANRRGPVRGPIASTRTSN